MQVGPSASSPAISLRGVISRRGGFSLEVPELDLLPGTVVGLCGRNGAGKSTLLELCAGLLAPDVGQVRVCGLDPVARLREARQLIGWMSDDMPLFPLTLERHARLLARFYPRWDAELVGRLFDRFELHPGRVVGELSKGEGTRARLALSMGHRPRVLLLDEPATGLDVPSRRALVRELLEVMQDETRLVLLASHQLADLERVADRVLVLEGGRIRADGPLEQLTGGRQTLEELLAGGAA